MRFLLCLLLLGFTRQTLGQSKKFVSDADQSLSASTIAINPIVDNVSGIYAPTMTTAVTDVLNKTHQWKVVPVEKGVRYSPEDLESSADSVRLALKKSHAEGLIAGRVSKGPRGVAIKLTLYVGAEGLPVADESVQEYQGFEVADLKRQTEILADRLMKRLPYQATVLSRKGQLVTVGIGSSAGLRPGTELTAFQIIKINRHPKFNFILGTENLTLGKVKIEKTDEYLSFASVITERQPNAVATGTKLSWDTFATYPEIPKTRDGKLITDLNAQKDAEVAYGDNPQEWKPESPPTFGSAGLMFGLGGYNINAGLSSGSVSGSSSVVPSIHALGEMWISPNWYLNLRLDTYVFSVSNGLSGSSPGTLNVSATETSLGGGYNFLLNDDFYGPKIKLGMGYTVLSMFIDGSTPAAFESNTYGAVSVNIAGEFPIDMGGWKYPLFMGAGLKYYMSPTLSESPTSSGNSSSQMANFALYGHHRIKEHVNIRGEVSFENFSSNFNGGGSRAISASSSSQTFTTFAGGLEYLF